VLAVRHIPSIAYENRPEDQRDMRADFYKRGIVEEAEEIKAACYRFNCVLLTRYVSVRQQAGGQGLPAGSRDPQKSRYDRPLGVTPRPCLSAPILGLQQYLLDASFMI